VKCFVPGCEKIAPYGLRWPGFRADVPAKNRGTLHHCREHQDQAETRRNIAMEKTKPGKGTK